MTYHLAELREEIEESASIAVEVDTSVALALIDLAFAAYDFRTDGLVLIGGGGKIEERLAILDACLARFGFVAEEVAR